MIFFDHFLGFFLVFIAFSKIMIFIIVLLSNITRINSTLRLFHIQAKRLQMEYFWGIILCSLKLNNLIVYTSQFALILASLILVCIDCTIFRSICKKISIFSQFDFIILSFSLQYNLCMLTPVNSLFPIQLIVALFMQWKNLLSLSLSLSLFISMHIYSEKSICA